MFSRIVEKNVFKLRKRVYGIPLPWVGLEPVWKPWYQNGGNLRTFGRGGRQKGGTGTQSCEFTSISSPRLVLMATVAHPWQDFPSSLTKIFRHQSAKVMSALYTYSLHALHPCHMENVKKILCTGAFFYARYSSLFWAPNGTRLSARCHFTGPKKVSISRAQPPFTCLRNWCCPHQKHYAQGHINHRCMNSYFVCTEPVRYAAEISARSSKTIKTSSITMSCNILQPLAMCILCTVFTVQYT